MKIRISSNKFFIHLFTFLMLPILLSKSEAYYYVLLAVKIVVGFIGLPLGFYVAKNNKLIKLLWALFCLSTIFSEIVDRSLGIGDFALAVYPIGLFFIVCYLMERQEEIFINALYVFAKFIVILYFIMLMINIITYKYGTPILYNNRNGEQIYFTYVIAAILAKKNFGNQKLKAMDWLYIAVSLIGMLISHSATTFIAAAVCVFAMFFYRIIDTIKISIVYFVIFTSVIILNMVNIPILGFIFDFFSKSDTFSNREWRWRFAIKKILEHPIIGNSDLGVEASRFAHYDLTYYNPHNFVLNIVVSAGLIGIILLFLLLLKNNRVNSQFYIVFIAMSFTTGLMESNIVATNTAFIIFYLLEMYRGNAKRQCNWKE